MHLGPTINFMFQRRPEQGYEESFPIKVEIYYANRKRTETGTYALRKDSITKQYIYYNIHMENTILAWKYW